MQFPRVPLFGEGNNFVPMIHVHDLAGWLLALACYSYSLHCTFEWMDFFFLAELPQAWTVFLSHTQGDSKNNWTQTKV